MNEHRVKQGFTVIEVLFVVALVAMLLAAVSPYLRAFHTSWQSVDRRSEVIQNARVGMDKIIRELRQAGSFVSVNKWSVTFEDVDENTITYGLTGSDLTRNGEALAGYVDSLSFTYRDEEGKNTLVEENVRSVEISMTVSDLEGTVEPISFLSMAYIRSTPISSQGYVFSKNSDFSTEDTVFSASDTFYIKVWSNEVDYTNLDYASCQLKKGGTQVNFSLNNNGDETYTGLQSLSGFAAGSWTVNIDVKDANLPAGRYRPSPAPGITIE